MTARISLDLNLALFQPGMRVAVAVSGGADSVALLRALIDDNQQARSVGLLLSVVHVHHGIRGPEADTDAEFVAELAARFHLPLHLHRVDTPASAKARHESIEEAARRLRYDYFRSLISAGECDAVATAHTLDDQAETVLHRFLRGAWTEGLGGIHPTVKPGDKAKSGMILRPLLAVRRSEVEAYLTILDQPWRTDSSNLDVAFTRNRIRRELMPILRSYNPQIDAQLANLGAIARDEESYWNAELARLLPSILLPGKPVRGGGRAVGGSAQVLAIEIERLRPLAPAVRRRVLRAAAAEFDHSLNFAQTETLLSMCGFVDRGKVGSSKAKPATRIELSGELIVVRTPRELRFTRNIEAPPPPADYILPIPGEVRAEDYSLLFHASILIVSSERHPPATVRACRSGDRVTLKHSSGRKTIKEVLERLHLPAEERARWPLIEWQSEIVWLRGIDIASQLADSAGLSVSVESLADQDGGE
jgi:tRNA(Ile)-lysidine synthase